jgi:N-methylhydantoinase A/oxoprolinase/acetone carboxylase beta subunit
LERPVDTILSGPAASARGGMVLSDLDDCVVIDMGGTSTDIALIEKGLLRNAPDGAMIGGWRTRVEAVDMWTFALGGDSEIRGSKKSGLLIGPERVTPLSFATIRYPVIKRKMEELGEARFLMAVDRTYQNLSPSEESIVNFLLTNGPSTRGELRNNLCDIHLLDMFLKSLRGRGAVFGIGLTPTDILHVSGQYTAGDVEAAKLGVRMYSKALCLKEEDLVHDATEMLSTRIAEELLKKMLTDNLETLSESPSMQGVIKLLSGSRSSNNLGLRARIAHPIVGLGGPARAFIAPLADLLDVKVLIPENYDVGNAVGAVCGRVSMFADVYVYPREKTYAVYSTFSPPVIFAGEHDAVRTAKAMATGHAMERGERAGGRDLVVQLVVEEEREKLADEPGKDALVQMHVRALAIGRPLEL